MGKNARMKNESGSVSARKPSRNAKTRSAGGTGLAWTVIGDGRFKLWAYLLDPHPRSTRSRLPTRRQRFVATQTGRTTKAVNEKQQTNFMASRPLSIFSHKGNEWLAPSTLKLRNVCTDCAPCVSDLLNWTFFLMAGAMSGKRVYAKCTGSVDDTFPFVMR